MKADPITMSHWGWGHSSRHLPKEHSANLCTLLNGVFGVRSDAAKPPVPLKNASLPEGRIDISPPTCPITNDRETRARHTWGRSFPDLVRGHAGDFANAPDAVAFPESERHIEELLEWAAEHGFAVIPRGGGTSVVGGVEARDRSRPTVCVSLRRMNRVLDVDSVSRLVTVEGGATGPELDTALRELGLSFRHFPQSWEYSTVGGWVATRAGGHFATVYTHIDDLVASCRMITPSGAWESRTLPGSGAGPSPDRAIIGSEGIYGIITQATLRVHARPVHRSSATLHFTTLEDAVLAARTLAQSHLFPSNCRLLDKNEALLNQVVFDGSTVLLVAFESSSAPTRPDLERAIELCEAVGGSCPEGPVHRDSGARAAGNEAAENWRSAFFDGPYRQTALLQHGLVVDTFETACTWTEFPELHRDMVDTMTSTMGEGGHKGVLSMRFTHVYPDGPAPYFTFITSADEGEQLSRWQSLKNAASEVLMRHGATITHHHAVGRNHRPWYDRQRPELFARSLRAVRRTLDPSGIMNPGVLIDAD